MNIIKKLRPVFGLLFGAIAVIFVIQTKSFTANVGAGVSDTMEILLPIYLQKLLFAAILSAGVIFAVSDIGVASIIKTVVVFALGTVLFQTVELFYNIELVMELLRDVDIARGAIFPYVIWQFLCVLCFVEVLYKREGVFERFAAYFALTALSFGVFMLLKMLLPSLQPIYQDSFQIAFVLTFADLLSNLILSLRGIGGGKIRRIKKADEPSETEQIEMVSRLWGRTEETQKAKDEEEQA